MNPLFQSMGGRTQAIGPFGQMLQQFNQFRANFQGDPKAEVMRLLQSGRINQQQLDQLQSAARQFQQFIR